MVANGEMLGLSLILEEVTQSHEIPSVLQQLLTPSQKCSLLPPTGSLANQTSFSFSLSSLHTADGRQDHSSQLGAIKLLHKFLKLSLQLEILRLGNACMGACMNG